MHDVLFRKVVLNFNKNLGKLMNSKKQQQLHENLKTIYRNKHIWEFVPKHKDYPAFIVQYIKIYEDEIEHFYYNFLKFRSIVINDVRYYFIDSIEFTSKDHYDQYCLMEELRYD